MALISFKRDFFSRDGAYYEKGTREYNGPLEDENGNRLIPRDAVVVSEKGTLPFQPNSPLPKPGFGAKPLEEQVADMIPGAGDDHQIHSADGGSKPVPLTDEEKKAKQDGEPVDPPEPTEADEELKKSVEEALPKAEKAAELVKETVDPLSVLNLDGDKAKPKK